MNRRRSTAWLALAVTTFGGLLGVPSARATSCMPGREEVELELQSLEIDGVAQDLGAYASRSGLLVANTSCVTMDAGDGPGRTFSMLSQCGAFVADENVQPTPPEAGTSCSHVGMHCHWPDVSASCSARCAEGSWDVAGCP